ncbi:TetR/AcrR family transcriptional regulator [Yinghuangia seranimata]|uniref:TetR/AcrR family transcriptional regulator n=1 Tax=Yinghuangia seranimata TaxID=408067 RepID=UPI00248CC5F4|nr:TetR/AcrR family transcriptional regulator [Yinghuangia seranimata]MDI2129026.1 TetR/AcrR family transcriptional regulator [Yinghuangia seranimata]
MAGEARRSYAKGRAKQREIIEQAMALFGEAGYRGTSMRELAARCGMSHPGLIHHFPSKEALLLAVLEARDEEDARHLLADDAVGVERLRRTVDVVERNAGRRVIVEMFTALAAEATSPDHPAHAYFRDRYHRTVGTAATDYEHARTADALAPGIEPASAARQLIALMDGLQVQWLYDPATDMAGTVRDHIRAQLTDPL